MKKVLFSSLALVAVVLFALSSTSVAHAQANTPVSLNAETGYGFGGRGGTMNGTQSEILHEDILAYFSEQIGLSVDDLDARLTAGETMADIAISEGLTLEEFQKIMVDARNYAVDQAVANGTITQTQADWMKSRSTTTGTGSRGVRSGTGMRGAGSLGTCPNVN